jgi:hypothetical protein
MGDQAGGLVDDDDVVVLVDDVERDGLGLQVVGQCVRDVELEVPPRADRIPRADALTPARQPAVSDEPLDGRA